MRPAGKIKIVVQTSHGPVGMVQMDADMKESLYHPWELAPGYYPKPGDRIFKKNDVIYECRRRQLITLPMVKLKSGLSKVLARFIK